MQCESDPSKDDNALKALVDSYYRVWALFLQWFSWFFALFLAIAGFIIQTGKDRVIRVDVLVEVFLGLLFFAVLGVYNSDITL